MLNFKKITKEDNSILNYFLKKNQAKFCLQTFEGLYLWRDQINISYAVYKEFLLIKSYFNNKYNFIFPIGQGRYDEVLEVIQNEAESYHCPYSIYQIQDDEVPLIIPYAEAHHLNIEAVRDYFEYWYDTQRMIQLKGAKLQSKRNHINYFKQHYNWSYQLITPENRERCIHFIGTWETLKHEPDNLFLHEDDEVFKQALYDMDFLNLQGGILTIDDQIVALSLGCPLNDDVFMILFEKARSDIKGAYPMIC